MYVVVFLSICMLHVLAVSLQFVVDNTSLEHVFNTTYAVVTPSADSSATLEFLGPEMASLQQLLATMTTGETSYIYLHAYATLFYNHKNHNHSCQCFLSSLVCCVPMCAIFFTLTH